MYDGHLDRALSIVDSYRRPETASIEWTEQPDIEDFEPSGDLMLIYGTLRAGEYNHEAFELDQNATFLGEGRLSGYAMRDVGKFPIAYKTGDLEDSIVVELYEVHNKEAACTLDEMERHYGYKRQRFSVDTGEGELENVGMYVMPGKRVDDLPQVPGGDWVSHYTMKKELGLVKEE